jgi:hypothetical protein
MLRAIAQTLVGLALAATPVLLWVAWSPAMFVVTLATCLLSAALLVALTEPAARDAGEGVRLPEAFLDEVQGLHPMIYHHSGRRSSRFQRAMRRLARLTPPARS